MAEPEIDAQWAENDVTEIKDVNNTNTPVSLPNKREPLAAYKLSGVLYEEPLPSEYINYMFNLLSRWQRHFKNRYVIGDYHITETAETDVDISERLGGTWVLVGADTLASAAVVVFKKTV
jgi:hypothetical protein